MSARPGPSASVRLSLALKRLMDMAVASVLLVLTAPIMAAAALLVWMHDGKDPLFRQARIGKDGVPFTLFKLRSMSAAPPDSKSDTTGRNDPRITPFGGFMRRTKIDEFPQLWNVLIGNMSLVGPRPQVPREVDLYTDVERGLLAVKPGVTDYASIVYSDLGDIVASADDPDLAYGQLVRPGKSRLGLFYAQRPSVLADIVIVALTAVALVRRSWAQSGLSALLRWQGADPSLVELANRRKPLVPMPPPGSNSIFSSREV
jgi:Sugar transferases involved in lipopolysaccharide synthesis